MRILKYSIYYTNILAIQNVILMAKIQDEIAIKNQLILDIPDIEVISVYNATKILL